MTTENQLSKQLVVVTQAAMNQNQHFQKVALFAADGTVLIAPKKVAYQADTTAVDLAALKVDFNLLLAKLRTAGVMATS